MGTLKRIGTVSQGQSQTQKTGGRLRRIDTGEIITYDPDPVRSLPNVEKITGGRQGASPSLPTASGWSGGRRGEENAAIAEVTKLRELRDEARQEFLNYRAASTAGITLGTETGGEYTGKKYKSEQEAYDAWQKYKKETEDLEKETGLEEYSFGKSVMGAVQKGLGQIAQAGGDTLALAEDIALAPFELLSGNDLGTFSDKGLLNRWAADIREEQEAVQKYYAPNAEKGGKAAQIFEELGAGVVAAVPQAVLALLTGGGSAAAQTTAGLTRTAAQAVSPGVAATARNAVRTMAKDPQYWTSFAQVVGGSYEQAMDDMIELEAQKEMTAALTGTEYEPPENQNAMRAKAALYAIGNGLLNAAVEIGGGIQTLPDELKRGGSAWRAWVDSMVDEGKEEVVQGVIERALQNPMYGMANPLFSTTDERAILNPVTAGQEFLGGAVVGGVLGGAQTGITRGINEAARRAAARQAAEAAPVSAAQPQRTTGGTTITADTSLFDRGILKNFNQARKYLIDFAQRNFPKSVVNAETGKTIGISRNGLDKFLSGNIPYEKYATGFHIPQLIENAHRVSSASNYHEETAGSIPTFEYYDSPIEIDGKQYNAHIRVKNTNVGDRYYGHTVSEVDDIKIEPPTRVPASETLTGQPENTGGSMGAPPAVNASTGRDPAADTQRTTPVEGTRPLNSDSTIAPGAEVVNTQRDAARADLEESGLRAGAREADIQTARHLSEVLGRNIRFYDGAQRQDPSARANGYFDGSTIYVNSRSANPVAQIVSHELTHSVEMANAYQELSSLVFDRIQRTGGDLEQLRREKQELYARYGKRLRSQEEVDQEIVAEYVEHNLLTNEQEILDLTRENPTLGRRIMDWIDRILARLGNSSAQERSFLTTARNTYARALEQTRTSREAGQQPAAPAAQTAPAGRRTERQGEPQEQGQEAAPRQQETWPEPETEPAAPEADQERHSRREEIRQEVRTLREDYAAGRISDEEFDDALDAIIEEEGL